MRRQVAWTLRSDFPFTPFCNLFCKVASTAAVLSLVMACGARHTLNSSRLKIIGGQPVTDDSFMNIVAIMRDELTVCSGTLIADDLVLTAAHCVEKPLTAKHEGSLDHLRVVIGRSGFTTQAQSIHRILDGAIHPDFWGDHRGAFDFAWLRITPSVVGIPSVQLPGSRHEAHDALRKSHELVIGGFGESGPPPADASAPPATGQKRIAKAPYHGFNGAEVFVGSSHADSCGGDSGGPAFVRVRPTVDPSDGLMQIGVTSRGPSPCGNDLEPGIYGMTSEAVCWLRESGHYRNTDPSLKNHCEELRLSLRDDEPSQTITGETFLEHCTRTELTPRLMTDLNLLMLHYDVPPSRSSPSCANLLQTLSSARRLNLEGLGLAGDDWLAVATNATGASMANNHLKRVRHMLELPALRHLDIRNNRISDMAEVKSIADSKAITVVGTRSQHDSLPLTRYLDLAKKPSAASAEQRALVLRLRDILAVGSLERKSRDLALKRHLTLDQMNVKSLEALRNLENLEVLSLLGNPELSDWDVLLSLPSLKVVYISDLNPIPLTLMLSLQSRGIKFVVAPHRETLSMHHDRTRL